ncbi:hypothetical protein GO755_11105 [Spirosoma sp. HMF4905]|uniref:Pentapeptide MXKDX repeat protein n=1 Tax=Spirosoma arboris TaxID=2682092 RepID=A0A7K1S9S0_9BACT|nr:hypothetical protein [Spirosoma arboris]MVM30582.1 hypothetical protein [Spirosoma arboris]
MKNLMLASVIALLMTGSVFAQDKTKKEAKMEAKELKHDAKVAKKEAKMENDHIKADAAKDVKHEAKLLKKDAKKTPSN